MATLRERYGSVKPKSGRDNTYTSEEVLAEIDMDIKANRRLVKLYFDALEEIANLKSSMTSNVDILQKILSTVENQSVTLDILTNDVSNVESKLDDVKNCVETLSTVIGVSKFQAWRNLSIYDMLDALPAQIG